MRTSILSLAALAFLAPLAAVAAPNAPIRCVSSQCQQAPVLATNVAQQLLPTSNLPVYLQAYLPSRNTGARYALVAKIDFGDVWQGNYNMANSLLAYTPQGWLAAAECGDTYAQIAQRCGFSEGATANILQGELTFDALTDNINLVIEYARSEKGIITHQADAFQCTYFFSRAHRFCKVIGQG